MLQPESDMFERKVVRESGESSGKSMNCGMGRAPGGHEGGER